MSSGQNMNLLDLPEEIIETIISYFVFNETSEARLICKLFNKHCQLRLNRGFLKVDKIHTLIQKQVKNKLPRRESERRNHPMARHVDILSAIETRLSLLGMSYMKYIDMGLCCFIPGKVLDELINILHILRKDTQLPRSHEFLQELRDISSMAMEHFDEKIVPTLKEKMITTPLPYPFGSDASCSSPGETASGSTPTVSLFNFSSPLLRGPNLRQEVTSLGTQMRSQSTAMQQWRKELNEYKLRVIGQQRKLAEQEKTIIKQAQTVSELEKKVNDLNQKFVDFSAEVLKEVQARGDNPIASGSNRHNENSRKIDNSEKAGKDIRKTDNAGKNVNTRQKAQKRKVTTPASTETRVKKTRRSAKTTE